MIDRKTVTDTAALARLELTDAEVERLTRELGAITGYVAQLQKAPTPAVHVAGGGPNAWRDDDVRKSVSPEDAVGNAPSVEAGFFKVPQIVE